MTTLLLRRLQELTIPQQEQAQGQGQLVVLQQTQEQRGQEQGERLQALPDESASYTADMNA